MNTQLPGPAPAPAASLDFDDIVVLVRRYFKIFLLCAAVGAAGGFGLSKVVRQTYKSIAKLSIGSGYYQNAALAEMGSSLQDPEQIKSKRQTLLDQALSPEYVDRLGEANGVFQSAAGDSERLAERESFKKTIETLTLDSNSLQISVSGDSPKKSFAMTNDVLNQIIQTFLEDRQKSLLNYRESLLRQIGSFEISPSGGSPSSPNARDEMTRKVRAMEGKLAALRNQFTASHPAVQDAQEDLAVLQKQLRGMGGKSSPKALATPRGPRAELYDEQMRKLKNLDIVLELEKTKGDITVARKAEEQVTPISPKKRNFIFGGLALGILSALLWIAFCELKRLGEMTADALARELSLPLLGELPVHSTGPTIGGREF